MNIATIASGLPVDVAGNPGGSGGAEEDRGAAFGEAFRSAASKHDGKTPGSRDAGHGEAATDDAAADNEARGDPETAPSTSLSPAAVDLLGRLMALSANTARVPGPPADANAPASEPSSDDGVTERIVISTVADLVGAPDAQPAGDKRIALRVTGMETHFEPRLDGASLVDEQPAPALAKAEPAAAGAPKNAGQAPVDGIVVTEAATTMPRPRFEDVLRRLNANNTQVSHDDTGTATRAAEPKEAAAATAESPRGRGAVFASSPAAAVATNTLPVERAASLSDASKAPTTGELITAQLAGRIVESLVSDAPASTDPGTSSAPSGGPVLRMVAGGAALKTLSIQLEPQDLGRVDVSMRLVDGRLTVELAASEPSTAAALAGDKHGLRKILEHAGFALDDAAITIVARDIGQNVAPAATASPEPGGSNNNRNNPSEQNAGGQNGRGQASGEERRPSSQPREGERDERGRRGAGSVYI